MEATAASDPFELVAEGDADALRQALAANPALAGSVNGDGISLVRWALYRGRRDLAELVVAADPPLDVFDAAAVGDAEQLTRLLDHDPSLASARSGDGFTALHFAAFLGGAPCAQILLDRGADAAAVADNPMRVQPLHSSVAAGQDEVSLLLVRAGAPLDDAQQGGYRPLHEAAHTGNRRVLDLLIAAGADPGVRTDDGATALDLAEAAGHHELVAALTPR